MIKKAKWLFLLAGCVLLIAAGAALVEGPATEGEASSLPVKAFFLVMHGSMGDPAEAAGEERQEPLPKSIQEAIRVPAFDPPRADANGTPVVAAAYYRSAFNAFCLSDSAG